MFGRVEQLAARWVHTPKVAGSSPAPATSVVPVECAGVVSRSKCFESFVNPPLTPTCESGLGIFYG